MISGFSSNHLTEKRVDLLPAVAKDTNLNKAIAINKVVVFLHVPPAISLFF